MVVESDLDRKVMLSIHQSIYITIFISGHELSVMPEINDEVPFANASGRNEFPVLGRWDQPQTSVNGIRHPRGG